MNKRITVCLCGSTRFSEAFQTAMLEETLAGKIVLSIGCNMKSDAEIFGDLSEQERADIKYRLDELHLDKIDMADEVLILNQGGYIGESTMRELKYARRQDKTVRFLEPDEALGPPCLHPYLEKRSSWMQGQVYEYCGNCGFTFNID